VAYSGACHSCRGLTVALSLPGPNGLALRPESQGKIAGGVEDPLELSYRIVQGTLAQAQGLLKNLTQAVAHPGTFGERRALACAIARDHLADAMRRHLRPRHVLPRRIPIHPEPSASNP